MDLVENSLRYVYYIKVFTDDNKLIPAYSSNSVSSDIVANVNEMVILKPGEYRKIPTGIKIKIMFHDFDWNYHGEILSCSDLALKHGVCVLNSPGIIDDEKIEVILINHGKEDFIINKYDRIAQLVIVPTKHFNYMRFDF